jgi:SSS family solute:Na+ symporter
MAYGTWAAAQNSFKSVGPPHLFGITTPLYPAVMALLLNLGVAVVLTLVFSATGVARGRDETAADDYEVEAAPPIPEVSEGVPQA